jgi:cysteine desulfurase / selenocysteine lyase
MLTVRDDFPFLQRLVNGQPLVYLDSAATTQKPRQVIDRVVAVYSSGIANVHRAVNFLASEVTDAFEMTREACARLIGADPREIVFVGNATHGINLVCHALTSKGPIRILSTTLEHHSNLVPWTERASVDLVPWDRQGHLDLDALTAKLRSRPALVTISRASNFLGTLQPIHAIIETCHAAGALVLVDASQSIAHETHNVRELDCDFLVFSGHKIYGPSGTGVLYIKEQFLSRMTPLVLGGHMVKEVHADRYTLNDPPHCFEAGTPNIEGIIGLGAAIDYIECLGYDAIGRHEAALVAQAKRQLAKVEAVHMHGPPAGEPSAPLVPFEVQGLDSGTVAKILASRGNVIVRSGFHCAQPAHDALRAVPTVRASFAVYNTIAEIDQMTDVLQAIARPLVR